MEWSRKLRDDLDRLANEHVERLELNRGYDRPPTPEEPRIRRGIRRMYFTPTRRACWAYVQAAAPIDVKKVIWHHERDELIHDPRAGTGHVDIDRKEDIAAVPPLPGVQVATYGWLYIVMHRPWLQGLASCHILERINDSTVIRSKTNIQRSAEREMKARNLKAEDLPLSVKVHLEADTEHSELIWVVFERYVTDAGSYRQALDGAVESLECQDVYERAVSEAIAKIQEGRLS
jgi:hypothetical protein